MLASRPRGRPCCWWTHPADAVEWLRDTKTGTAPRFGALSPTCQAAILEHADEAFTQDLIAPLDARLLTQVLEELPSDEAADVLIEADDRVANDALERLAPETADSLRTLLSFDPESAGGIMATDFVVTRPGERIGDVVKAVRKGAEDIEPDVGVFVLDQQGRPIGYLPDRALLTNTIHAPVEEVMRALRPGRGPGGGAQLMAKYGLVAVVDDTGALLGVISAEDAAAILEEEVDEDIALLVGVGADQQQTRLPCSSACGAAPAHGPHGRGRARERQDPRPRPRPWIGGRRRAQQAILRYLPLIVGLAARRDPARPSSSGGSRPERWTGPGVAGVLHRMGGRDAHRFALRDATGCGRVHRVEHPGPRRGRLRSLRGGGVGRHARWGRPDRVPELRDRPGGGGWPFLIALSDVSGSAIYIFVAREIAMR